MVLTLSMNTVSMKNFMSQVPEKPFKRKHFCIKTFCWNVLNEEFQKFEKMLVATLAITISKYFQMKKVIKPSSLESLVSQNG